MWVAPMLRCEVLLRRVRALRRCADSSRAQEKVLRKQSKNPHRNMPTPTPGVAASELKTEPLATPPSPTNDKWMMVPSMEDFGVRRPFDTAGQMPQAGQGEWPIMSRTMTRVRWSKLMFD